MKTLKAVAEKLTSMPFVDAYLSVHMAYAFTMLTNARLSDDEAILSRVSPVVEMLSQVVPLSDLRAGMWSGTETSPCSTQTLRSRLLPDELPSFWRTCVLFPPTCDQILFGRAR